MSHHILSVIKYIHRFQHQLYALTFAVSDLFRDERIVLNYNRACEVRPQVERLIVEAMRNGDRHRPTMALANYWLREKNLVHKLFKVFVPRYEDYSTAFTALHMLGKDYEKHGMTLTEMKQWRGTFFKKGEAVLEMRGNELPPIIRPRPSTSGWLNNVLISSHLKFKKQEAIAAAATPATEKQL